MAPPRHITEPVVLGPSPARDMYTSRIGSALTPRRVAQILIQVDQGEPAPWHDLLNELRQKDGVLHSVLQTRESALVSAGYGIQAPIEPGQKKPTEAADEVAAFCREAVSQIEGFDRGLAHLADAIYKSYSVIEQQWQKQGRYVVPVIWHCVQGRRFAFDTQQQLRWYDDGLRTFPGDDVFSQYPGRFIRHQPRVNGDAPTREGLGRVLVWLACFRNWAWRDWMLFGELFGKPWRIVKLDRAKAQTEDELVAQDIADNATSSTSLLIYDSIDVEIRWPDAPGGSSASPSPSIIDRASADMALATLGQLGTTGDVQNGLGGRGDAREKVRADILKSDDRALSGTLRDQLLRHLVLYNFGPKAPVPYWTFLTEDKADTKALLEAADIAVNKLSMKIPAAWAHDVTGFPSAMDGDALLGSSAAAPAPQQDAAPETPAEPEAGDPGADPTETDPAEPEAA